MWDILSRSLPASIVPLEGDRAARSVHDADARGYGSIGRKATRAAVTRRVEDAAVAVAGALVADEPVGAGVERDLDVPLTLHTLFRDLVPVLILDTDVGVRALDRDRTGVIHGLLDDQLRGALCRVVRSPAGCGQEREQEQKGRPHRRNYVTEPHLRHRSRRVKPIAATAMTRTRYAAAQRRTELPPV